VAQRDKQLPHFWWGDNSHSR
ncbi:hypothetical protein A2U01_0088979, partial [Trifolium medium]|nr:hypothetical protein [Trifolium medium]